MEGIGLVGLGSPRGKPRAGDEESYLAAEQAREYGIIDEIAPVRDR